MKRTAAFALLALVACASTSVKSGDEVEERCHREANLIALGDPDDSQLEQAQFQRCMQRESR